jgi:hypothetical protein
MKIKPDNVTFSFRIEHISRSAVASLRRSLSRLVTGIVGSNPARGMGVCLCISALFCTVEVEAFATGWSLVRRSPAKRRYKITKPPVWGGQGPYKDWGATDDDDDDYGAYKLHTYKLFWIIVFKH